MTWTATSVTSGQLRYDVDGVFVAKNLARQFVVNDDFSGHYSGGVHQTVAGCANNTFNGTSERIGILDVAQNGQQVTITSYPTGGPVCTFSGTLNQLGQMGAVQGTYSCSSGDIGNFQIFEMQVNPVTVSGRFTASSTNITGCQATGYLGGLRVTTF